MNGNLVLHSLVRISNVHRAQYQELTWFSYKIKARRIASFRLYCAIRLLSLIRMLETLTKQMNVRKTTQDFLITFTPRFYWNALTAFLSLPLSRRDFSDPVLITKDFHDLRF